MTGRPWNVANPAGDAFFAHLDAAMGRPVVITAKRQLDKRELRRRGLRR